METRIYPSWEQIQALKNPLTEGELHLLRYLDDYLPRDPEWKKGDKLADFNGWLIFAQPFLNGSRPDVIIFNPFVGLVIYEVKDWNLRHYSWGKNADGVRTLVVRNVSGNHKVKSPNKQVQHYKDKILGQLVPMIGEEVDRKSRKYGLIKTALYLHNATTEEARELLGSGIKNYQYFPIFGKDSLNEASLGAIVPDVKYSKSKYWNRGWNENLMFWLKPPYHSIEQGIPLNLKGNQYKVALPSRGHHRVRGVAGSGKTQALAYRAGKLASEGFDVLILSFNITLWHYVKDMIQRAPFTFEWNRITFNHFHGFCKDKLNEFGEEWPKSPVREDFQTEEEFKKAIDDFFKSTVPFAVRNAAQGMEYQKYDAILIDEGQDYHYEWYGLLNDLFLKERDELLVVSDKKQNIYERELDWLDKRVTRTGLDKFKDPYIDLTASYRMPQRVAEMSNEFSELFGLNQELKVARIEGAPVLFHSQHIVWVEIKDDQWLEYLYYSFLRLQKEEYNPTDIVMLLPDHKHGHEAVEFFGEKNVEVNHVFDVVGEPKRNKRAFWMGDSRMKISTIHSFKGWELLNIVMFIPEQRFDSQSSLDAIIYTAITRTRENLIVLNANSRYTSFGRRYPNRWMDQ